MPGAKDSKSLSSSKVEVIIFLGISISESESLELQSIYGTVGFMSKYDPLRNFLETQPSEIEVKLELDEIANMVGGLPSSAADHREWWANTRSSHSHSLAWLDTGRVVSSVVKGESVIFSPVMGLEAPGRSEKTTSRLGRPRIKNSILNGVVALEDVLKRAGYPSILHAVAAHTVFLDPLTVSQTNGKALFPIVRDPRRRGEIDFQCGVMYDDNNGPTLTFLWAAQQKTGQDVQFNHVWGDAKNPDLYTALWNMCVTPAFLAKTTDGSNHPDVTDALKCRSFELFGNAPSGFDFPKPPSGYDDLQWQVSPPPVDDLETAFRIRLGRSPKSGPARTARELGWLFSNGVPDESI